ncbi:DUF4307 domain-containing protein [Rarobacter incanus]|uniref:Uncharacterized protein DUF4307 n=1 Tax=Rarobacter incanus TaxID=153494 RepID=A0A542SNR1_9MICO|nr:DUF4307 domain-containing protein [Rarobacter incanus]TQK76276.1 uncharacterized protein DUF4307 [Rarobacter incanus]
MTGDDVTQMLDEEGADTAGTDGRRSLSLQQKIAIGVALALGCAGAAWAAFGDESTSVDSQVISFKVNNSESTTLTFNVTKPESMTVRCEVEALSHSYVQVGFVALDVGPSDAARQIVSIDIPTTETAVSAVVRSCEPASS